MVSSLVFLYNESVRDYRTIVGEYGDYAIVYKGLKDSIEEHNKTGELVTDVHQVEFLFYTMKRMNALKHNILIYKTLIERYLVKKSLEEILKMLPVSKELDRLKKWAAERPEREKKEEEKRKTKEKKKSDAKRVSSNGELL